MLFLAVKNLFQERMRLVISAGGVAFSVLLIMSLQGLYQGWSTRIGEYIGTIEADYWITQSGATDMVRSPSVLPLTEGDRLDGIDGIDSVKPFSGRRVSFVRGDDDVNLYVVAVDTENDVGAPARVVQGKTIPQRGELIIDRVVAQSEDIAIGDIVSVGGQELEVVGYSEGGYLLTFSFAFITTSDAEAIRQLPGMTSYFLVSLRADANRAQVLAAIEDDAAVDAIAKDQFIQNNVAIVEDTVLPIILVLVVIGFAVGMAVIGLTIFTSTIEKAKEYGVLKAIGVSNRQLYIVVIEQALIAAAIGYALGLGLAVGASVVATRFVPQFITEIRPLDAALVFGATLVMGVAAAFIPVRRLSRIDPAEVFRS